MKKNLLAAIFIIAFSLVAQIAQSQSQPGAESASETGFVEQLDVRVVNVDVYVSDKDGQPVNGLTADDFSMTVDGRPVAISNFYAVVDAKPSLVRSVSGRTEIDLVEESPVDPSSTEAAAELPEDQRLWLMIYVDNYNVEAIHRNRVLREMVTFLNGSLQPDDRVMIVSYERSLHTRHSFHDDPSAATEALLALQTTATFREQRQAEWEDSLGLIEDSRAFPEALDWAETHAEYIENERSFTLTALNGFVDSLRGLPGRKALIYVSDGIPLRAADSLFQAVDYRFRGGGHTGDAPTGNRSAILSGFEYDSTNDLDRLAIKASSAQVAFYPIDAAGQRAPIMLNPQYGDLQIQGMGTLVGSARKANLQGSLARIAERTGGKALLNRTRALPGLAEIEQGLRNYYSLGFTPSTVADSRFRNIEVRLKKKGLRVRHRQGYRALSLAERLADKTHAALVHSFEDSSEVIDLAFGRAGDEEHGQWLQPVEVRIPLGALTYVPRDDGGESARVRVALATADEKGRTSAVDQSTMTIEVEPEDVGQVADKHFVASFELLIREGGHKVAATVHDETSSKSWTESGVVLVN